MNNVREKSRLIRWASAVSFAAIYLVGAGPSFRSAASATVILIFAWALGLIQERTQRPRRSFYMVALASSLLLVVLIDASWQGRWKLATFTWLGITALALIWTVHYERTERLN